MDELVHHCLRELSFDGDLGSNISRLRDFIIGFYSNHGGLPQVVDDAFCAFVWAVIVEQPVVRVGIIPAGVTSEVYVAPQTSAKRKAAAKGEELAEDAPPTLQLVQDARGKTLEDLKRQYGDGLRIAVDPETSFVAITGSHVRPPKLSPMVYTALQLVTRGREEGITTVELGRKTKYDQKTCFYLVKQLVELDFVIKIRRGGVGNHTCIHKYFVERSPFWQHIQKEEAQDDEAVTGENIQSSDSLDQVGSPQVVFDPIDSRHLSSLPLVKNRIVKLLKASKNYMHASNNLLMTIGFMHPTKTDRRFFQTRLRELIQQGVIERVLVPTGKVKDRRVKCIRLVTADSQLPEGSVLVEIPDIDEDEKEIGFDEDATDGHTDVKAHLTIHKQVSNLLEGAGPSGLTLNEICTSLGNFDRRTIELLLTRASQNYPPSHLSDLGTADLMETFGRERRHRYFTIAAYKTVMTSEQLKDTTAPHVDLDLSRVGEFAESDPKLFYDDAKQLRAYQDSFREKAAAKGKKRQRRDDDKQGATNEEENEPSPKRKRGRPRKTSITDDIQPLPKKRGRPRKHPLPEGTDGQVASAPEHRRPQGAKNTTKLGNHDNRVRQADAGIEKNCSGSADSPTNALSASERHGATAVTSDRESAEATRCANALDVEPVITADTPVVLISFTPPDNQPSAPADVPASARAGMVSIQGSQESGGPSSLGQPDPACSHIDSGNDANIEATPEISPRRSAWKPKSAVGVSLLSPDNRETLQIQRGDPTPTTSNTSPPNSQIVPLTQTREGDEITADTSNSAVTASDSSLRKTPSPRHDHIVDATGVSSMGEISTGEKRKNPSPSSTSRPAKRTKISDGTRSNINISHLRRENELHRVIEGMGGIVNLHTKELFEAHTSLLNSMTQVGEPTSAPVGTRLDKRTAEATLKRMENCGRIKMLKTSLVSQSRVSRPACLLYFPDTSQDKINEFLRQLSQGTLSTSVPAPIKTLEQPVDFGADRRAMQRSSLPLQLLATHELEKVRRKSKRAQADERAHQNEEAKATLQRKAEEAKLQREQNWDELLSEIHPEPVKGTLAVRIRAVRNRFMQSTMTKDAVYWEDEIREAIREAQLAGKKVISKPTKPLPVAHKPIAAPPPLVANPPEKSIAFLIDQQGPPIAQPVRKEKEKAKVEEGKSAQRRARFHWTREFDELARDASAIIRARCRDCARLDLSALDQVFPAVPRNSVRQRITHLRENAADDLYMKRLEDRWYTIWVRHRGSSLLPDEDPSSPSNFGLIKHVEFLRKHVDKNALRVGFVEREAVVQLPASVEKIQEQYDVVDGPVTAPAWDFMWNTIVEEGREKHFLRQAFTKQPDLVFDGMDDDIIQLAEAASKMVFGTPNELYDPDSAARLLHSAGDQPVSLAISNLLSRGILSKLVRDPKKPKPGRALKISDMNLNAIGGAYSQDMFQDAIALEDIALEKVVDEMDWPLLASDGDIATLIQLFSDDQVDFRIDLTQSQASRPKIDWNSKRADDDDIETTIRLKFMGTPVDSDALKNQPFETTVTEPHPTMSEDGDHGYTCEGTNAACILNASHGLVNCIHCIETGFSALASGLDEADRNLSQRILEHVRVSKATGVSKAMCFMKFGQEQHVLELIQKMATTSPPVLLWTGFTAPVIVASQYGHAWSVVVSEEPLALVLPRRWLDLRGAKLNDAWTAALRAVVGVVVLRPGITQAELRWRLRVVYDRQEILEVIMLLEQEGSLEFRLGCGLDGMQTLPGWPATLDEEEERRVFWFLGKYRHWYQVG